MNIKEDKEAYNFDRTGWQVDPSPGKADNEVTLTFTNFHNFPKILKFTNVWLDGRANAYYIKEQSLSQGRIDFKVKLIAKDGLFANPGESLELTLILPGKREDVLPNSRLEISIEDPAYALSKEITFLSIVEARRK